MLIFLCLNFFYIFILKPAGPIYLALIQVIKSTNDLSTLLFIDDKQSTHHELCINTLNQYIDNIITKITEFMPKEGILGTNHNSALISLLMPGNQYPDNYFWQCEKVNFSIRSLHPLK